MLNKIAEIFKKWWYAQDSIFYIHTSLNLEGILLQFKIFDYGFTFNIEIPNFIPWYFKSFYYRKQSVTKHKIFEEQFMFTSNLATGFSMGWFIHQHHAGLKIELSLLGLGYLYDFIDERHWNYTRNDYEKRK